LSNKGYEIFDHLGRKRRPVQSPDSSGKITLGRGVFGNLLYANSSAEVAEFETAASLSKSVPIDKSVYPTILFMAKTH
jgi:hypothetical protein